MVEGRLKIELQPIHTLARSLVILIYTSTLIHSDVYIIISKLELEEFFYEGWGEYK